MASLQSPLRSQPGTEYSQGASTAQHPLTFTQAGTQEYLLLANLDDVRTMIALLKTMAFVEDATCVLTSKGIKLVVDQAKSLKASLFLQSGLFTEYRYEHDEDQSFNVSLTILLECLNVFGGNDTSLRMCYAGYGSPLVLMLEEDGVVTDCSIRTMEPEDRVDIDIRATDIPAYIIMKSHWLSDVFADLDVSSELLKMHISPDRPYFRLSTDGNAGTSQVDCPKESGLVESFQCEQTLINRYRLSLLKPSEKALSLSHKISIRMNAWGVLSIQYLVQADDGQNIFIEFLCLPSEDDEHSG